MSYKKDASKAHKAKLKNYAEGGVVEPTGSQLLATVEKGLKDRLDESVGEELHDVEDEEDDEFDDD